MLLFLQIASLSVHLCAGDQLSVNLYLLMDITLHNGVHTLITVIPHYSPAYWCCYSGPLL